MKVYVDELPKSCWDCPCIKGDNGLCKLLQKYVYDTPKSCPLQSLADYTKQVRKEICDKIRENAISHNNLEVDMYYITPQQLYEIEKGEKDGR